MPRRRSTSSSGRGWGSCLSVCASSGGRALVERLAKKLGEVVVVVCGKGDAARVRCWVCASKIQQGHKQETAHHPRRAQNGLRRRGQLQLDRRDEGHRRRRLLLGLTLPLRARLLHGRPFQRIELDGSSPARLEVETRPAGRTKRRARLVCTARGCVGVGVGALSSLLVSGCAYWSPSVSP